MKVRQQQRHKNLPPWKKYGVGSLYCPRWALGNFDLFSKVCSFIIQNLNQLFAENNHKKYKPMDPTNTFWTVILLRDSWVMDGKFKYPELILNLFIFGLIIYIKIAGKLYQANSPQYSIFIPSEKA